LDRRKLKTLLKNVRDGSVEVNEALDRLKNLPFEDIGFAKIDSHRGLRCGAPEVVFCEGKSPQQILQIAKRVVASGEDLLATRAEKAIYEVVKETLPKAVYHELARTITLKQSKVRPKGGTILIITAGTSDIPVAEEARITAEMLHSRVRTLYDVGVAGIHRLLERREEIFTASVLVVVAGMEGALASVVGGMVDRPVIAVPTSVGYGANFGGLAPLLTMLNSCAAGVSVVNIDNGFGAGYIASLISRK